MAVKPWLGAIKQPTEFKNDNNLSNPPKAALELEYVFGYRVKDCKNNLKYTSDDKIVYNTAGVGVVLNQKENTQQFFTQHIDDITAIAVTNDGRLVATGEIGPKPSIYIWETKNPGAFLISFKTPLLKGVASLSFSPSGKRLVGVDIN